MSNNIELEGLENVAAMLEARVSDENYIAALKKACALVERSARQKAPEGNGALRNSIQSRVENDGNPVGIVFTPLEYAPYIEYGTGLFAEEEGRQDVPWHYKDDEGNWHSTNGMKPHPYMRPALEENREEIKRILKGGNNK